MEIKKKMSTVIPLKFPKFTKFSLSRWLDVSQMFLVMCGFVDHFKAISFGIHYHTIMMRQV